MHVDTACFCDQHLEGDLGPDCAICAAVAAEREACASIAEALLSDCEEGCYNATQIAAAIRAR
jgi:hypothetical protein